MTKRVFSEPHRGSVYIGRALNDSFAGKKTSRTRVGTYRLDYGNN